jgi:hypothetical protein
MKALADDLHAGGFRCRSILFLLYHGAERCAQVRPLCHGWFQGRLRVRRPVGEGHVRGVGCRRSEYRPHVQHACV